MSLQLMSEINNNYLMATCLHKEIADTCWTIYMPGFAMQHEYQYLSESCTQRKLKRYMTSTYHTFAPDKMPARANIAEPLLSGKNRKSLKAEDSYKILREIFRIYQEWEESALQKYQQIASELFSDGEVSAFNFVSDEIIKDVKAELVFVTDMIIGLNAMDWDLPTIFDQQTDYFERFEYLIKTMLGKSEMFHHWNGAYDPESRVLFKKTTEY